MLPKFSVDTPVATTLVVMHKTVYRYREPVRLNAHVLMMRPREGADLRIKSHRLDISPLATLRYASDVQGNTVTTASFGEASDVLTIEARTVLDRITPEWPIFDIDASAISYPFAYADSTSIDLGALLSPQYVDPKGELREWALSFVRGASTDTLSLLKDLSAGVSNKMEYRVREMEGTQDPLTSLTLGHGTCRDFAVLFAEAARWLGLGSRIVSGYLHSSAANEPNVADPGATHAWAQVFLPGAGWLSFDPTNRRMGDYSLIPVAVGTDIDRVMPVTGSYAGPANARLDMSVHISVCAEAHDAKV